MFSDFGTQRSDGDQTKEREIGEACNTCGRTETHRVLAGKPDGSRPLARPSHRWKNSIKIYFKSIYRENVDKINVCQDRYRWRVLMNAIVNLQVP